MFTHEELEDAVRVRSSPIDIAFAEPWLCVVSEDETEFAEPPRGVPLMLPVKVQVPLVEIVVTSLIVQAKGILSLIL